MGQVCGAVGFLLNPAGFSASVSKQQHWQTQNPWVSPEPSLPRSRDVWRLTTAAASHTVCPCCDPDWLLQGNHCRVSALYRHSWCDWDSVFQIVKMHWSTISKAIPGMKRAELFTFVYKQNHQSQQSYCFESCENWTELRTTTLKLPIWTKSRKFRTSIMWIVQQSNPISSA